jgi:hypothetical protein
MVRQRELEFCTCHTPDMKHVKLDPQANSSELAVMFWSCFTRFGDGLLVVVEGTLDVGQFVSGYLYPRLKRQKSCMEWICCS